MKKYLLTILAAFLCCLQISAQTRDIALTAGVCVPMYRQSGADMLLGVHYGQFSSTGLGFRAGLQWTPEVADVEHGFGLPLAVAWRSKARSSSDRLRSGAYSAAGTLHANTTATTGGNLLASFLLSLFSDIEFYGGITPLWTKGPSTSPGTTYSGSTVTEHWTEKRSPLSLTLDAGMNINYSLWRFDIKLMPAFHFDPFGALVLHSDTTGPDSVTFSETPVRWFFTFSGGLAFRF